jgi:hypothetical protein
MSGAVLPVAPSLNQRVPGSSPGAPTIDPVTVFAPSHQTIAEQFESRFDKSVASAFSLPPFELGDGAVAERGIASEIVRVHDRAHVAQRVPGDGGDLGFGGSREREPRHGGASRVVERDADHARRCARLAPGRAEAVRCPRLAVAVGEHDGRALGRQIERSFERRAESRYTACLEFQNNAEWSFVPHESVYGQKNERQQDLLWKMILPAAERQKALRHFDKFNLNEFTLFDSEEGLLEMLATRVFDLRQ